MPNKIVGFDKLVTVAKKAKDRGKKIVYAHGAFDLIHSGHIHHLEEAKKFGDILIVTVTPDRFIKKGPDRPRFKEEERMRFLAALECVDFVSITDSSEAVDAIKALAPDTYVKGEDVKEKADNPDEGLHREIKALKEAGGKIQFINSLPIHSTELLNEYFSVYPEEIDEFLDKFAKKYPLKMIFNAFEKIRKLKVLIIGDAIIDVYQYVATMSKSPKSNHIAARYLTEEEFAGGIMACANHVAGFCNEVLLVSCLGDLNSRLDFIENHLEKNIQCHFLSRPDAPTTLKRRFVDPAYMTKLFEVYSFNDSDLPKAFTGKLLNFLDETMDIETYDVVLVADYGHGFLIGEVIDFLSRRAEFLALNVQTNSANYGFNLVTKYSRADYVCIDEPEIRLALHSRTGDLKPLIKEISEQTRAKKISITRGHRGCMTYSKKIGFKNGFNEIPVLSTKVIDTVGAGDAFFATSSLFAKLDLPMELVGFIGNVAGAIKVGTLCNKSSVNLEQMKNFIERLWTGRK